MPGEGSVLVHDQVLILVLINAHLTGLVLNSINLGTTLVTVAILLRLLEQSTIDVSAVSPDGASGLQSPPPIGPFARALSPPSILHARDLPQCQDSSSTFTPSLPAFPRQSPTLSLPPPHNLLAS